MMIGIVLATLLSAAGDTSAAAPRPTAAGPAIVAHWGTRDTVLMPRQHFRLWTKIALLDSGAIALPTSAVDPRLFLSVAGREIEVPGDLVFGKATSLALRPGLSHFAYALSHLWNVSGSLASRATRASLKLRFDDPRIRVEPDSLVVRLLPVDNPAIESWFTRYDSLAARLRRAGWTGHPTPAFCEKLGPAFDSLDASGKLTGNLAGSVIYRSLQSCREAPESRDFVLTPAWPEFTEFQLCHYRAMRNGQVPQARCSTQVEAMNALTRRILNAKAVVASRDGTHLLITPRDTVAVPFPHYR